MRWNVLLMPSGVFVKICNGHYIWCLGSWQATTGSVPARFDTEKSDPFFLLSIVEKNSFFQSLKNVFEDALKTGFKRSRSRSTGVPGMFWTELPIFALTEASCVGKKPSKATLK